MGTLVRSIWQPSIAGIGIPSKDRAGGAYDAYVPDLLAGQQFPLFEDVALDVADATAAIARFDGQSLALTSTEALARLLLRAESVASSDIEGLVVSPQRLLRADAARKDGLVARDNLASEVLANVDAMAYAIEESDAPISIDRIIEVHRRLLETSRHAQFAGVIRTQQNWIGGNHFNPIGAIHVPPPHTEVRRLLADLCDFCNENRMPAIAQAAIAHAQFETIHPFVDGNGRTGRALIYMVLRRRQLAQRATPPISLILATNTKAYYSALNATRFVGAPNEGAQAAMNAWISMLAAATTRAVGDAERFESRIEQLQADWRSRLGDMRADASAFKLLEQLPATPVITVKIAAAILGRTFQAANTAIEDLVARRILTPTGNVKRNRAFEARELIDSFTALERELASPGGDTMISPPVRSVPMRPRRRERDSELEI